MESKVSVIIPCYNGEQFISNAIKSIYAQDYGNVELVVVDDGSTDDSKSQILKWKESFQQKNWALKYVCQENQGIGSAIDTGLKHITGEYLALLDADDIYLPGSISKKAHFLDEHPECSMVRSNGWVTNKKNRWLIVQNEEEKQEDLFSLICEGKTNNWAGTYMVRTNILFAAYPDRNIYPSRYGQNFQIILPVAYKNKCGFIDEPLMEYIRQSNSLSSCDDAKLVEEKSEKNAEGYRYIFIHVLDHITENDSEKEQYILKYNISYYRAGLRRAKEYNNLKRADFYRSMLNSVDKWTLDDKVLYYSIKRPLLSKFYKVLRKIKSWVIRSKS